MPNNKKIKGKKKSRPTGRSDASRTKSNGDEYGGSSSIDNIIQVADFAFQATQDAGQAADLYSRALSRLTPDHPDYAAVLEKRANVSLSVGNQAGALDDYQAALKALLASTDAEEATATKSEAETCNELSVNAEFIERKGGLYLYVGQLSEGKDALESYRRGIECLQSAVDARTKVLQISAEDVEDENRKMDLDDPPEPSSRPADDESDPARLLEESRQKLSAAYCSTAELYLTDLCYDENAEQECESYILQALRVTDSQGEPSIDALQAVANLRLSQQRPGEAFDCIMQAYDKMKVGCQALASLVGVRETSNVEEASELEELDEVQHLPGFEFRCQTAKLLLECATTLKEDSAAPAEASKVNQCVQAAVDVLGSLLAENDEVVEVWFLTGEAFASLDPPNKSLAFHYWRRAAEMLKSVQETLEQEVAQAAEESAEDELQQQLDDVMCQLEDITAKLEDLGCPSDDDVEE